MRLIGTLSHQNDAQQCSNYLRVNGIENHVEPLFESTTGEIAYQVWIQDEDLIEKAEEIYRKFKADPKKFNAPDPVVEPVIEVATFKHQTYLTIFLLSACVFVFLLESLEPIANWLMYDLPADINGPYWKGVYPYLVAKITHADPSNGLGPMFVKIREGEIWRSISPIFLHANFLHILFNMLWLWYLGRPIEQRIGPFRTLLLTLIAALVSNFVQYLTSGPFFIGYSGVIMALAGFIWMRERVAPWEGYPLNQSTLFFLLFFIGSILLLQIVSFFLQITTGTLLAPNIANAAHITGAIVGALLGRMKYFSRIS